MTTDLQLARAATPDPLSSVAERLGLPAARVTPWGRDVAKVSLADDGPPTGRLVLVSALTPTPAGEGKTTVSVGLADGLRRRGRRAVVALREPSLGPVLGQKGGAGGGGRSQVIPMTSINLHFTGDLHAVGAAHNLLSARIDEVLFRRDPVDLGLHTVAWPRVVDLGDRALREVMVGLGGRRGGLPRQTGFHITAASEVMAVLCLAKDLADLRRRLGHITVGRTRDSVPVSAEDLGVAGAMAVLLRDALQPNLVQTLEGTPALVHGGPFANIAQGTNSVVATRLGLAHAEVVVTEAGFGFDLGGEKFLDLIAPELGVAPHAVVLVATVRALQAHGGGGVPGPDDAVDVEAVGRGLAQLDHHTAVIRSRGLPVVVALNRFAGDPDAAVQVVRDWGRQAGVAVAEARGHAEGGAGMEALADAVWDAAQGGTGDVEAARFQVPDTPIPDALQALAEQVYGADGVILSAEARRTLRRLRDQGLDRLPVCVAKTPSSLTDRPGRRGVPTGFDITVQDLSPSTGAGFVVALAGDVMRMPAMGRRPGCLELDLDGEGRVVGLD